VQHLPRDAFERAAHQQHLAAGIDARQQTAFAQPVAKRLLADVAQARDSELQAWQRKNCRQETSDGNQ
jgi:hypothetical protein